MNRDVLRQKIGQAFRLRPLPSFYNREGARLPFWDDLWMLRHVSDDEAEFRNRHTGVAFRIELADLEEIRIPDYLIIHCDITITGDKAALVSRKQLDDESIRRVKRPEDTGRRESDASWRRGS
jgi:hypothetical protein